MDQFFFSFFFFLIFLAIHLTDKQDRYFSKSEEFSTKAVKFIFGGVHDFDERVNNHMGKNLYNYNFFILFLQFHSQENSLTIWVFKILFIVWRVKAITPYPLAFTPFN